MLDDLKMIHERDAQDALGIAEKQGSQLTHAFSIHNDLPKDRLHENVVYTGMGGSALAALLSKSWPGYRVPFEVVRNYNVPAYVSEKTLVIACSYSGNTEETLSALQQAVEKGATVAVIAGGGKLLDIARERNLPYVELPKAEQPRYAALFNLRAIIVLAEQAGLIAQEGIEQTLQATAEFLDESVKAWLPTVPTAQNPAKQLAQELMGRSPVIYAGPLMAPAAYKWKIGCNENAKNVAWWGELPEFNHNEFLGWSSHPPQKPYAVVDLRSDLEHERVQKRFEVSERMLSGMRPPTHVIQAQGTTLAQQLLWTVAFGDFVTVYLGLLNGVNPAPVELVERFKKELG